MMQWLFGSLLISALLAAGQQPPAKPEKKIYRSPGGRFQAVSDPAAGSTVISSTGKRGARLWQIDGWHAVAFLSDDPVLIVGASSNNVVPSDYKPSDVMLRFFRDGKPLRTYALADLIDPAAMRRTAAGFYWGSYLGLHEGRFLIELVDGRRLAFDPATGTRIQ
jgi:hypothetical protein